jgi:hypothetical protein
MKLIQILLPLSDNEGRRYGDKFFKDLQRTLTDRFGGLTAYTRAPAEGLWSNAGTNQKDDIVVVEVMAENFDRTWWKALKSHLEEALQQEEIVIRAQPIDVL